VSEVFGAEYAARYDRIYRAKRYDAECDAIEAIFRAAAPFPVRELLDLGCGTGGHALELARRGYRVTGVDASAPMLSAARRKAEGLADEARPRFVEARLGDFDLGVVVDAALMMFAVLGYLVDEAERRAALANVRRHLRDGGLFVFDVWYAPAVEAQGPSVRESEVGELRRRAGATLDRRRRVCDVTIELLSGADARRVVTREIHCMRYFDREELAEQLAQAGLELVRLGAFDDPARSPDATTWNVLGVARAVEPGRMGTRAADGTADGIRSCEKSTPNPRRP